MLRGARGDFVLALRRLRGDDDAAGPIRQNGLDRARERGARGPRTARQRHDQRSRLDRAGLLDDAAPALAGTHLLPVAGYPAPAEHAGGLDGLLGRALLL